MIKRTLLLFLVLLVVNSTLGDFKFNFENAHIDHTDYDDSIVIPCVGGSNDFQYEFKGLPQGWYAQSDRVYIPKGLYTEGKNYGIKIGVYDRVFKKFLKKSFLFTIKESKINFYVEAEYDTDISDDYKIDQIIRSKRYENNGNKPGYIAEFPELSIVEQYIAKGDVAFLRKVINDVISSGKNCQVVADYLTRFLSTIQVRLTVLKSNADAVKQDLLSIEAELTFLQKQLDDRKGQSIDFQILKRKIELLRRNIGDLVSQNKDVQKKLTDKRSEIKSSEDEVYNIKVNIIPDAQRKTADTDAEIQKIDHQIKDLYDRIAYLQIQKDKFTKRRLQARITLQDASTRIKLLSQFINLGQTEIRKYEKRISQNLVSIKNFENKIDQIQTEINLGSDHNLVIKDLQAKIKKVSVLLFQKRELLRNLEKTIKILDVHVVNFEKTINKHYYNCYNFNDSGSDSEDVQVVAPIDAFTAYLKDVFGYTPSQNIRARFSGEQITFKHLNIFSPSWIKVYGIPFSAGYGNNMDVMDNQFRCQAYGQNQLDVFDGKILSVNRNFIEVKTKTGEQYTVHLGGCTRIENVAQHEIPQIGDSIFFKGKLKKIGPKKEYNGYHLTCY